MYFRCGWTVTLQEKMEHTNIRSPLGHCRKNPPFSRKNIPAFGKNGISPRVLIFSGIGVWADFLKKYSETVRHRQKNRNELPTGNKKQGLWKLQTTISAGPAKLIPIES